MDSTRMQDRTLKNACTVELDGGKVLVRVSKDVLREKGSITISLDTSTLPSSETNAVFRPKEVKLSGGSYDSDTNSKISEVRFSPVSPVDDLRSELSRTFDHLLGRSPSRLENTTQNSMTSQDTLTSLMPRALEKLTLAASHNVLTHHETKQELTFFDLPLEVRREIYKFVAAEFQPPQGGCVCRDLDKKDWVVGCEYRNIDVEAIWRKAWDRRNTVILNINTQIRSEAHSMNLKFAPACFFFEGTFCDHLCLNAFEQLLNDRQLRLIRKVVLRLKGGHLPDPRAKNYAADMERLFNHMWRPVLSNFPCAAGQCWDLEKEDQGEAGWRLSFTRDP